MNERTLRVEGRQVWLPAAALLGTVVAIGVPVLAGWLPPMTMVTLVIVLLPMAGMFSGAGQPRLDLGLDRMVVHRNSYVNHPISYANISEIEVVRRFGTRRVRVTHRFGKETLPVPFDGWLVADPRFDAKVDTIRQVVRGASRSGNVGGAPKGRHDPPSNGNAL